jgi:hypothetical protein
MAAAHIAAEAATTTAGTTAAGTTAAATAMATATSTMFLTAAVAAGWAETGIIHPDFRHQHGFVIFDIVRIDFAVMPAIEQIEETLRIGPEFGAGQRAIMIGICRIEPQIDRIGAIAL